MWTPEQKPGCYLFCHCEVLKTALFVSLFLNLSLQTFSFSLKEMYRPLLKMKTNISFSERSVFRGLRPLSVSHSSYSSLYLAFRSRIIVCLNRNMFAKLPQTRRTNSMCVACLNNYTSFCQRCKDKQWCSFSTWLSFCKSWIKTCFAHRNALCIYFAVCVALYLIYLIYFLIVFDLWTFYSF